MERRNDTKKTKWQYPQMGSQTPKILQLPRRQSVRRNATKGKTTTTTPSSSSSTSCSLSSQRVKLEVLFHQERSFDRGGTSIAMANDEEGKRRGKVADGREIGVSSLSSCVVDEVEEAKWRFQAEMLRSECNLLRIEKEIALKKMERRKKRMERTLRSAVHTLLSGKQRISRGKSESTALEDEISYLIEKLNELKSPKVKDKEARSRRHKQGSVLRREIEKFEDDDEEVCVKGIRKMAEASFLADQNALRNNNNNIDTLSSKMESLSKGFLLERAEKEHGSTSVVAKTIDLQDCSRQCKQVMRKIADEVRAESEQWSQMQEMLCQVREEMEELTACRDFWQNRAIDSDSQLQNLHSSVEGWRRKALSSETKLKSLQEEVLLLQEEIENLRKGHYKKETEKSKVLPSESEKRVLICRLKENRHSNNGEGRAAKPSCSRPALRELKNGSVSGKHRNSNVMKM
ncbi:unnamed protein product [Cochlearia groenlandica]